MAISFGPWTPDTADWAGQGARTATNVLADSTGYIPFPQAVAFGSPVPAAVRGAIAVRKQNRTYDFYAGTATAIYKFNATSQEWDDVSQGGGYTIPADDDWGFVQFGDLLIAVNQNTPPQVIDVEAGGLFADLADSPPRARGVSVFQDFVVLFGLVDDPNTIQWSDINDAESWTFSSSSLAGSQTFPDGGQVTAVTSANTGFVFQEGTVRRMVFIPGSTDVFNFERAVADMGLRSPYAYSERAQSVYFLSEDGFYKISPQGLQNMSAQRVSQFFFDDVDSDEIWRVRAQADLVHPRIYFAYPSVDGGGFIDKFLAYDWFLDTWTLVEQDIQSWLRGATQATTLEALDALFATLEDVEPSLDSRTWEGGAPILGVFDNDNQLAFFTGAPKEATLDTPEVAINEPYRSQIVVLRPGVDTSAALFRVGVRERPADSVTFRAENAMTSSGRVFARGSGRLHRFRMRIPVGTTWTHATGIGGDFEKDGDR